MPVQEKPCQQKKQRAVLCFLVATLECPLANCLPRDIRSYCNGDTEVGQVVSAVVLYRTHRVRDDPNKKRPDLSLRFSTADTVSAPH